LGDFAGKSSFASDINNLGQVVGRSFTVDSQIGQHAALWNGTDPTDLNTFLDENAVNDGWLLEDATAINDNGWITGSARNRFTGEFHAYLLSAIPEPETWAMTLVGLAGIGFAVRRRKASGT
jgi:probable HAF family extracellular repeat protein